MEETISIEDQLGRRIVVPFPPKRIISLVPSQTELLFDLNLSEEVVGVTKFCIHPNSKTVRIPKIGGTKKFNYEKIQSLKPDLIIGNKEENFKEGIEKLAKDYPVYVSDISTLDDSYKMMLDIGKVIVRPGEANDLVQKIKSSFDKIVITKRRRALYLIWKDPYMSTGGDTFINQMMGYAGFENVLSDKTRYPTVAREEMIALKPEYILLSSEPYPFTNKHIQEFKELLPQSKVVLVDGEMFSWFGSRLRHATEYFQQLENI